VFANFGEMPSAWEKEVSGTPWVCWDQRMGTIQGTLAKTGTPGHPSRAIELLLIKL